MQLLYAVILATPTPKSTYTYTHLSFSMPWLAFEIKAAGENSAHPRLKQPPRIVFPGYETPGVLLRTTTLDAPGDLRDGTTAARYADGMVVRVRSCGFTPRGD